MPADSVHVPKISLLETLFGVFLRLVAISCFWFGLNYWGMLIGYSFHGSARFDLLTVPWRAASTILAVAYPVAALGLWLLVSWGPVIWTVAAATEIAMFGFYPETFGTKPLILILHGATAAIFVTMRLLIVYRRVRQGRSLRFDSP